MSAACQIIDCGTGPALVLLHGAGVDPEMWSPQVDVFSQDHRVIAPALPGHVERPQVTTVEEMAEVVFKDLKEREIEHFAVTGLSLGGMVALEMAAQRPDAISHLVLVECVSEVSASWVGRMFASTMLAIGGLLPPSWLARLPAKSLGAASKEAAAYLVPRLRKTSAKVNRAVLKLALNYKGRSRLAQVSCRSLVMVGELNTATHKRARAMADALPNAQFMVLPGASHLANWDARDAFNATLSSFLREPA